MYSRDTLLSRRGWVTKPRVSATGQRARGILDLSGTKLVDRPVVLEEKLRRTPGIIAVEINAFSNRITVEFDPSVISLDKLRASLRASNET